jgi:hypothetical protein
MRSCRERRLLGGPGEGASVDDGQAVRGTRIRKHPAQRVVAAVHGELRLTGEDPQPLRGVCPEARRNPLAGGDTIADVGKRQRGACPRVQCGAGRRAARVSEQHWRL